MITNIVYDNIKEYYSTFKKIIDNILVFNIDYYKNEDINKLVLSKSGAEKLLQLISCKGVNYELISKDNGMYVIKASIKEESGLIGESYGIATIEEFESHNTAIKLAQKRALVGAVINFFGISEFFTQDLEDTNINITKQRSPHFLYTENKIKEVSSSDELQNIKNKLSSWKALTEEEKAELLFLIDLKEINLTANKR